MALEKKDMLLISAMYNFEVNFFNFEKKHKNHKDFFKIKDCRNYLYHYHPYHIKICLLAKILNNMSFQEAYLQDLYPECVDDRTDRVASLFKNNKTIKDAILNSYIEEQFNARIYNIFLFEAYFLMIENNIVLILWKMDMDNKKYLLPTDLLSNTLSFVNDKINKIPEEYLLTNPSGTLQTVKKTIDKNMKYTPLFETLNRKNSEGASLTLGDKFGLLKKCVTIDNQFAELFNEINNFGIKLRHEDGFKKTAIIDQVFFDKTKELFVKSSSLGINNPTVYA
jgi:hypothetical protein